MCYCRDIFSGDGRGGVDEDKLCGADEGSACKIAGITAKAREGSA